MSAGRWSLPGGRVVLPSSAPREAWLAERRNGIGGSDVPVLLGASPYGSPYEVWLSKVQPQDDTGQTEAMLRGHRLEPVLAQWFSDDTGIEVRRCGLVEHRGAPWRRVSPDRIGGDDSALEIKTHSPWAGEAAEWDMGGHARRAYVQGQWALAVTGRSWLWLAALVGVDFHVRGPFDRDEPLIATMCEVADRFWADCVIPRVPPPVDWETAGDDELDARWPQVESDAMTDVTGPAAEGLALTVDQLRDITSDLAARSAEARRVEKVRDSLRTRLRAAAAGREWLALDGVPVARWATTTAKGQPLAPRFDTAAFRADHPDLAAEYLRPAAPRFTLVDRDIA